MNISSNVNKNIDILSTTNIEDRNTSVLGDLFSINLESDVESKASTKKEFIIKDDEIKVIEYLSNLITNFQNKDENLTNLKKIKNHIELDLNISTELKENILKLLSEKKFNSRYFKAKVLKKNNTNKQKLLHNIPNSKPIINQKHFKTNFINNENNLSNINNINSIKKSEVEISKTFKNRDIKIHNNEKKLNGRNESIHFVKKVKKNNHPNKIYKLSQTNTLKYERLNEKSLQDTQKQVTSNNFYLMNNQISDVPKRNKTDNIKLNSNQIANIHHSVQAHSSSNNFSQQNDSTFTNSGYNSVLENFIDNLDLTQKGWTSKLVSRIENALLNGGEEIEFNLKPKNLGVLKVSVKIKNGIGNVKIIAENVFVTSALNQNENYLQKLFNDQGINLDFSAQNGSENFGSKSNFNQNSKNEDKSSQQTNSKIKKSIEEDSDIATKNNSSRHMINVIA